MYYKENKAKLREKAKNIDKILMNIKCMLNMKVFSILEQNQMQL